jgi:hypothetical protein
MKSPRARRVTLAFALAILASPALAQDSGSKAETPARPAPAPDAGGAAAEAPKEAPKPEEPTVEVKGNRYRFRMNTGAGMVGILPNGLKWEKRIASAVYAECKEKDPGAGLRIHWVEGMEGEVFVLRETLKEWKDLGALTEDQKLAIRERYLADRAEALAAREKAAKAEAEKLGVLDPLGKPVTEDQAAAAAAKAAAEKEAEAAAKKGDDLLKKFPAPEWGRKKLDEILQREVNVGSFRTADEAEFISGFKLWSEAYIRKQQKEAETGKKEAGSGEKSGETPAKPVAK